MKPGAHLTDAERTELENCGWRERLDGRWCDPVDTRDRGVPPDRALAHARADLARRAETPRLATSADAR